MIQQSSEKVNINGIEYVRADTIQKEEKKSIVEKEEKEYCSISQALKILDGQEIDEQARIRKEDSISKEMTDHALKSKSNKRDGSLSLDDSKVLEGTA